MVVQHCTRLPRLSQWRSDDSPYQDHPDNVKTIEPPHHTQTRTILFMDATKVKNENPYHQDTFQRDLVKSYLAFHSSECLVFKTSDMWGNGAGKDVYLSFCEQFLACHLVKSVATTDVESGDNEGR